MSSQRRKSFGRDYRGNSEDKSTGYEIPFLVRISRQIEIRRVERTCIVDKSISNILCAWVLRSSLLIQQVT